MDMELPQEGGAIPLPNLVAELIVGTNQQGIMILLLWMYIEVFIQSERFLGAVTPQMVRC